MPTVEINNIISPINWALLHEEIEAVYPSAGVRTFTGNPAFVAVDHESVTEQGLQDILSAHDAQLQTTEQLEATQATSAKSAMSSIVGGLSSLSAQDKGYVVLARIMARNDGANNATITGITTRAQATSYVTGRANWLAVPSAARPMLGDILEAQAVAISLQIALLS